MLGAGERADGHTAGVGEQGYTRDEFDEHPGNAVDESSTRQSFLNVPAGWRLPVGVMGTHMC
jgi:hypothetical protein